MLTRAGVAKRIGRSIATVRRLEGAELHPWTDARGVHQFNSDEVERLARNGSERDHNGGAAPPFSDAADTDARGQVELLELELSTAQEVVRTASQLAADLKDQNQELRSMAIESLELVQVLLGSETPYEVRRCLSDLRRRR